MLSLRKLLVSREALYINTASIALKPLCESKSKPDNYLSIERAWIFLFHKATSVCFYCISLFFLKWRSIKSFLYQSLRGSCERELDAKHQAN